MAEERTTPRPGSPGAVGSIRLMGVPVRLHFTFVLLLIFLLMVGFTGDQTLPYYALYVGEKLWTIMPAAYILQQHLATFKQFPPRQAPASFNVGALLEHVIKTAAYGV